MADEDGELFQRIVREAREKLGWSQKAAEHAARVTIKRVEEGAAAQAEREEQTLKRLRRKLAHLPTVNYKPSPKTAKERMERALGPDDGRRRGGSPVVQGGAPGLGKRR